MERTRFLLQILRGACSCSFVVCSLFGAAEAALPGAAIQAPVPDAPDSILLPDSDTDEPHKEENDSSGQVQGDGSVIVDVDLSGSDGYEFSNETEYTFDPDAIMSSGYPISPPEGDKPTVLILHTHATECYTEPGAQIVTDTRSPDPEKNMLAVGDVITDTLTACGVNVLHCTEMHDLESYNQAYSLSLKSAREYLEKYPSIKYVLDVHRDAIGAQGGWARTVTHSEGADLAQIMLVVGTNQAGADHPGWKTNLSVALHLQSKLEDACSGWARPINLRKASFNQQYAPGSLLVEIGTCANTLDEAKASAKLFAKAFAAIVKGK